MLAFVHGPMRRLSDDVFYTRKNLLLLSACFERLGELIPPFARRWMENAVDAAEGRYDVRKLPADGAEADHELHYTINRATEEGKGRLRALLDLWTGTDRPLLESDREELYWNAERRQQAELIRDIFHYPQRYVTIDSRWRTSTVVDLARAIYEERTFEKMPVLADALMDAGCDSDEIIAHCQGGQVHVRGCWVLDLLLDKR
jgi:hypothetical protein